MLVLVPGMLCDARLFAPQIAALSPRADIHIADIVSDDSITGMAERLLAEVPASRFALAGLSLGGIVAMEAARLAPERVERLALISTGYRAATPGFIATRTDQIARVQNGDLRTVVIEEMKGFYLGSSRAGDAALLDLVVEMAMAAGPVVFERQTRALIGRADQTSTLAGLRMPTLILCGSDDQLCPPRLHESIHALVPGSELRVMPGIGHLPTLEAPAETSAALGRWLSGTTPGAT